MLGGLVRRLLAWPAYRWVILFAAVYFAVAVAGTWINYVDLHISPSGTGGYDLSINQQALSSTIHGNQPYPFYEATNCGRSDRCSLLLIHPVFVGYLVAIPYALAPSAFTLFSLQDAALGLAALPLYGITRRVAKSTPLALVTAGVYLVWWPSFTGIFSFHWEAFLPLELFLVFWLWLNHRYWLAFPVVILSYVTLEVMPVLMFLVAAFFLLDWVRPVFNFVRMQMRYLFTRMDAGTSARVSMSLARLRKALLKPPQVRASLLLLFGSVAAYLVLHDFVTSGGALLGLPPQAPGYSIPLSQPVHSASFTLQTFLSGWQDKVLFWIVMFGSLAMIPLLAPRLLVLSVPWVLYTTVTSAAYVQTGTQYAFISAAVLFVGFAYGVAQLKRWAEGHSEATSGQFKNSTNPTAGHRVGPESPFSSTQANSTPGRTVPPDVSAPKTGVSAAEWDESSPSSDRVTASPPSESPPSLTPKPRARVAGYVIIAVVMVGVLAFNVALNPLIPGTANLRGDLGKPFHNEGGVALTGYDPTDYNLIEKLAAIVGSKAVAAIAPAVFTYFANDPYAYPIYQTMKYSLLPFNVTTATQYAVLVSKPAVAESGVIPSGLVGPLYNSSVFGVRAWIPKTYFGDVWLLERGYVGVTEVLGSASLGSGGTYTAGNGLSKGVAGRVITNNTSLSGRIIASKLNNTYPGDDMGTVFLGPNQALAAGSYELTLSMSGRKILSNSSASPASPVASVNLSGTAADLYSVNLTAFSLNASAFGNGNWTLFDYNITLPCPLVGALVTGENLVNWFALQVNFVSITAVMQT
jgi:uncharacterized membrane protein